MAELRATLAGAGLNHVGVVSAPDYDRHAPAAVQAESVQPGTRSIVVVASGGRAHWDRFLDWVAADPVARLARSPHPLDTFCAGHVAGLGDLLAGCRAIFPTFYADVHLDFIRLGELAGLGRPSELGLLVSEPFGPWFGLRAALFVPHALDPTPPARCLCEGCPAPCQVVCPARIVGVRPFPWADCVAEQGRAGSPCQVGCDARAACIVAPAHRYDVLELTYHHDKPRGRALLCARFGVRDELLP
jgi:hypothetical protein